METLTIKEFKKTQGHEWSHSKLELEQMLDQGDAVVWKLNDKYLHYTHWLTTRLGSTYLVRMEEVKDGLAGSSGCSSGSHSHCSVVSGPIRNMVSPGMISKQVRAFSLLEEALDWIGAINLSPREEILSYDLQRRIARLLSEARECTE